MSSAWRQLGIGAAAIGAAGLLSVVGAYRPPLALAALFGIGLLFAVLRMPTYWLPSTALALYALVPQKLYTGLGIPEAINLGSFVLTVWAIRRALDTRTAGAGTTAHRPRVLMFVAVALIGWLLMLLAFAGSAGASVGWVVSITLGALLPFFVPVERADALRLRATLSILGAVLGLAAVWEKVREANPLFDQLYRLVGYSNSQHWSVYRSEGSFGHPLYVATFLSVAAAVALASWLSSAGERTRWLYLLAAAAAAAGLASTVSRGALIALVGGAIVAVLASVVFSRRGALLKAITIAAAGAAGWIFVGADLLSERTASSEAEQSGNARTAIIDVAIDTARRYDWIGAGPGASSEAADAAGSGGLLVENSYLQLLISIGVPGLLLFAILMAGAAIVALRRRNIAALTALTVFLIGIFGYNAIDGLRTIHVFLGCILLFCLAATDRPDRNEPSSEPKNLAVGRYPGFARVR
ncbi:O-antigen ligase family protein [Microbacteriaceae bacterium 4G12]